jgi:hypothetical protein
MKRCANRRYQRRCAGDIGGYRLHIHCTGSGSPTVILESALPAVLDVRDLLRLTAEQQASLAKLQQLVVEHVLSESQLSFSTGDTWPAPAPLASDLVVAIDAPNVVSSADEVPSDPDVVRLPEPEPVPAASATTSAESGTVLSEQEVVAACVPLAAGFGSEPA